MTSLDAIARDPAAAAALGPAARREVQLACATVLAALAVPPADDVPAASHGRLIPVREAAALLGVSTRWVYDRANELPWLLRLGQRGAYRADEAAVLAWRERQR